MIPQRLADLDRAQHRCFRGGAKNQRATIAGWQAQKSLRLGDAELLGSAHDRF
jgi:hypothetical protein